MLMLVIVHTYVRTRLVAVVLTDSDLPCMYQSSVHSVGGKKMCGETGARKKGTGHTVAIPSSAESYRPSSSSFSR